MDSFEQVFANLRRGPWHDTDPNTIPQERGFGDGQAEPQGWLADNSVSANVIQASAVTTAKLAAEAVTAGKIEANTITANEIAANTITASEIAANAITASEIAANTITASEIAADAITTNELAANAVETDNILAANVTASKIVATITGKKYGADDGSAGAPGFFFDAAGTTGMYHTGSAVALVDGTSVGLDVDGSWLNVYAFGARPQADDTQALGTSARRWTEVWAVDGTINTSDEREKMDIEDSALGLGFVRSLRPVSFRWRSTPDTQARESAEAAVDREAWAEHRAGYVARIREIRAAQLAGEVNDADGDEQVEAIRAELEAARAVAFAPIEQAHGKRRPGRRQHYGLIAQDVKAALDAAGVDAAFWKRGPDGAQSLAYSELIAPMIRAVQELAADNEALSGRVAALEADRA